MKKLLAVLLSLSLLLCSAAALAEEENVTEIENTPSYDGVFVNLGDTGMAMYVPADFQVRDTPDGAFLCMGNSDMIVVFSVLANSMDDIKAQIDSGVAEGSLVNAMPVSINALYFMTVESADLTMNAAFIELDENQVMRIVFNTASDFTSGIPAEMIGSLLDAEETEEAQ